VLQIKYKFLKNILKNIGGLISENNLHKKHLSLQKIKIKSDIVTKSKTELKLIDEVR